MIKANSTIATNFDNSCSSGVVPITFIAWIVLISGLVTNIGLLFLVLKKLASGKRNDKLFLFNIIAANLVSLLGSLLGEILARGNALVLAQRYCIYYHHANFISLFNTLTSMAALCYNFYENIVKFPGNRSLSFSLSLKIVAASWLLSIVLVPAAQSGFIIAQGVGVCDTNDKTPETEETSSFLALIVLVSIWIAVNARVIRLSLTKVHEKLKQHREQTEHLFHSKTTAKIISFNKQAYTMISCFSVCWISFGIAAALTAADVMSFHSCVYFACLVTAHVHATSTPLIYLTIDKRFRIKCCTRTPGHAASTRQVNPEN